MGFILLIEDEPAIAESISYTLSKQGFEVHWANSCEAAKPLLLSADFILLDLTLPDGDGLDLLRQLREHQGGAPVIVVSSREEEEQRISALEEGADDYVSKPFSPRELAARIRAVQRRSASHSEGIKAHDEADEKRSLIIVNESLRQVLVQGKEVELTKIEFDLLHQMYCTPNHVLSRQVLIDRIWGEGYALSDRTIDSHVKSLRRKLTDGGAPGDLIGTVRGIGYRLRDWTN